MAEHDRLGVREAVELLRSQAILKGEEVVASGRLFSVDSVTLGAGATSAEGSATQVGATLALNAFSYVPPAPAAATTPTETPDTTGAASGTDD